MGIQVPLVRSIKEDMVLNGVEEEAVVTMGEEGEG